mmetsp:Transcript_4292/g.11675  ORF Transcript_4292/g.11675 Transcript_4292/m.11675 type:complete len:288 (+) Transcript_4292:661-1524(+)
MRYCTASSFTGTPDWAMRSKRDLSRSTSRALREKRVAGSCLGSPTITTFLVPCTSGCSVDTSAAWQASSIRTASKCRRVSRPNTLRPVEDKVVNTSSACSISESSSSSRAMRSLKRESGRNRGATMFSRWCSSIARARASCRSTICPASCSSASSVPCTLDAATAVSSRPKSRSKAISASIFRCSAWKKRILYSSTLQLRCHCTRRSVQTSLTDSAMAASSEPTRATSGKVNCVVRSRNPSFKIRSQSSSVAAFEGAQTRTRGFGTAGCSMSRASRAERRLSHALDA